MAGCPAEDRLNQELFDAFALLIGQLLAEGEDLAGRLGIPMFAVKALHWLDGCLPMKELGRRLRCDPSFVTAVADALEQRGLARREPDPADRRIRNLVLTAQGQEFKQHLERELLASMPWSTALDPAERAALLSLIRKLTAAQTTAPAVPALVPPLAGAGRPEGGG